MKEPAQSFISGMQELGLGPRTEDGLIVCDVVPVAGHRAGGAVPLGVAIEELVNWPQAPPHWIHVPADVEFSSTNSEASCKPGWLKHSRNCAGWGDAPAAVSWHAHVQAVLCEVIA